MVKPNQTKPDAAKRIRTSHELHINHPQDLHKAQHTHHVSLWTNLWIVCISRICSPKQRKRAYISAQSVFWTRCKADGEDLSSAAHIRVDNGLAGHPSRRQPHGQAV